MLPINLYIDKILRKSTAFRELSNVKYAYIVLFEFVARAKRIKKKRARKDPINYHIANNGKLKFSYSEAKAMGISRELFIKIIRLLVKVGFIDRSHRGGGCEGDQSLYALSDRWREYGTPHFIYKEIPKDIRKGKGWDRYHQKRLGKGKNQ